jgi:hypothetical protein
MPCRLWNWQFPRMGQTAMKREPSEGRLSVGFRLWFDTEAYVYDRFRTRDDV